MRFANELRYRRNGLVYYGRSIGAEYAKKVMKFLNENYAKLIGIVKDALEREKKEKGQ